MIAKIIQIIYRINFIAIFLVQLNQRVADANIAQMADVEFLVRVVGRIFN